MRPQVEDGQEKPEQEENPSEVGKNLASHPGEQDKLGENKDSST